jgi:hypothetical protein
LRRVLLLMATVMLLLAALLPTSVAAATQPAAGTFVEGPATITSERQSGNNLIVEISRDVVFTGTYTGTGQAEERIVIHGDGSTSVHISIAFTGLACGAPVTLDLLIVGQGQLNEDLETGTIAGSYRVLRDGIGHGSGKFSGLAGVGGDYEGRVHCG